MSLPAVLIVISVKIIKLEIVQSVFHTSSVSNKIRLCRPRTENETIMVWRWLHNHNFSFEQHHMQSTRSTNRTGIAIYGDDSKGGIDLTYKK